MMAGNNLHRVRVFSLFLFLFLIFNFSNIYGQNQNRGAVSGIVREKESQNPLEFATITVRSVKDSSIVQGGVTDKKGKFKIGNIPYGRYIVIYSFIGFRNEVTPVFNIDDTHPDIDLGTLLISAVTSSLNEVIVEGERSTYVNTIDRKVFNVGKDLTSKTGSVSDLMQNIPSVTVDIDGVVSLRGSSNVLILINGKPSVLMGANRAAVLQQIPASTIERIEVITNPSAKYKPDGTAGIINIVMKKNRLPGFNSTASVNIGNENRYNGNIAANYNPGKINLSGSYSIRQDDRIRLTNDSRTRTDLLNDSISYSTINIYDHSSPLSQIISGGIDYEINDNNTAGITASYDTRNFNRHQTTTYKSIDSNKTMTKDYDRIDAGPQTENDLEFGATAGHNFKKEGHELNLDFVTSKSFEKEDNHYSNIFRIPSIPASFDNTLLQKTDNESQLTLEYINPLSETSKIEAGYVFEYMHSDMNYYGESLNTSSSIWEKDTLKSNRFIYISGIHVLYGTFEKELGKFGFLGGLRAEEALINTRQVTTDTIINSNYFRLYPTIHLDYKLTEHDEFQLNYSHRIQRPEEDDLNPFPEYQDPYNLRKGNPRLKPEDIHSVEMGYQYKSKNITFLSTIYYRYMYNGMTRITNYINDTVLLTSLQNLTKSQSAGLELILTSNIRDVVTINLSTNTFYNTIDASSLGYYKNKSIITWSANLSAGINISTSTVIQITSNYGARRLTPQGEMSPSFVMNTGFRQEFLKGKGALIITVSDIFNSLRNNSILNTPELFQTVVRKRSARIIYAGLTYTFGNQNRKKEPKLNYDNQF